MRATASVFIGEFMKITYIIQTLITTSASNYGSIIAMFLMPAIATGTDKIEFTV